MTYTVTWDTEVAKKFINVYRISFHSKNAVMCSTLVEVAKWCNSNLSTSTFKGKHRSDIGAYIIAVPVSIPGLQVAVTYTVNRMTNQIRIVLLTIK